MNSAAANPNDEIKEHAHLRALQMLGEFPPDQAQRLKALEKKPIDPATIVRLHTETQNALVSLLDDNRLGRIARALTYGNAEEKGHVRFIGDAIARIASRKDDEGNKARGLMQQPAWQVFIDDQQRQFDLQQQSRQRYKQEQLGARRAEWVHYDTELRNLLNRIVKGAIDHRSSIKIAKETPDGIKEVTTDIISYLARSRLIIDRYIRDGVSEAESSRTAAQKAVRCLYEQQFLRAPHTRKETEQGADALSEEAMRDKGRRKRFQAGLRQLAHAMLGTPLSLKENRFPER